MEPRLISRIAPTPSGYLHTGNGFNFVLTWLFTRLQQGKLILRIDDLDQQRVKTPFLEDIFYTLDWLNLDWDSGPEGVGMHQAYHSQIHRIPQYEETIACLQPYSFACQCSRKDIQAQSTDGQYPGTCIGLNLKYKKNLTSLRIILKEENVDWQSPYETREVNLGQQMRHFVIQRKDGLPAYQVASLTDDMDMEVNFIIRGEDLLASTAAQLYLSTLLEGSSFSQTHFFHHPLVMDKEGQKLSKSEGAPALLHWRKGGKKEAYFEWISRQLGMEKEKDAAGLLSQARDTGIDTLVQAVKRKETE